jgi:Spy/CpxP family protein refolding chaperone
MKRIISTAAAAGLLAGALMAPALLRAEDKAGDKPEAHEKGGHEGMAERMREKLGISEEQEAKLKTARRARRDKSAVALAELGAATRKLQDQLEDKASEKDLSGTLDRVAAARQALRAEEDRFEATMSSILTPTQRAKMILAMQAHMHGRGPGGMRGGKHEEKRYEKEEEIEVHED